jgi:PadR family transcriptional regulator AphA
VRRARTELNLTELVALALVCEGPTHGWRIVRALRARGEIGEVWASSGPLVYRAISRLQDGGFIRATPASGEHGPDRTILTAEPAGERLVGDWLLRPVAHVRDLRTELLLKLLLLERRGLDRRALIDRQLKLVRPVAASLRSRVSSESPEADVVALWRAVSAESAVEFLETLAADESSGTEP